MKLEVGEVLSGTLKLVRKIAEGGMGSVWTAEHLVLGREVAVKFMAGPWASVPSARTRFLREARMTAQIDSPHVVRVLDCRLDAGDEPYMVLELLHGETLEQRVRRRGALSVSELVEIMSQACEALAATHGAGIVHRDLKPENFFLMSGPFPFVKLLDYGVARPKRADECLDVDRLPAGTPQYMSPEHMFDPESIDERSDLFSLAAVAYFGLTRQGPFEADSLEGLYFAIGHGAFRRPSLLRPELPRAVDRWFEKALDHDPPNRFASAREMARAFQEAVRDVRAPELPPLPLRRMRRSRKSALAALGLTAAVAVCGLQTTPPVPTANASPHAAEVDGVAPRTPELPAGDACGPVVESQRTPQELESLRSSQEEH